MDLGTFAFFTLLISVMLFIIQRTESKKRLIVIIVMLLPLELIRRYVFYRGVHSEAQFAVAVAVFLNLFFWLFIGRYNPVGSSERTKVLTMDD
jgi:hypothetical protein